MKGLVRKKVAAVGAAGKRQQILDAAYTVFSRKGYYRATVDEIIALADTGKGTVYNYFSNKENLFYTLIEERSAPFHKQLDLILVGEADPVEKIYALTREFLTFYAANADLWRVLMHEIRAFGAAGYSAFNEAEQEKYRRSFERALSALETVIQEGMKRGIFLSGGAKQASYGLFSAIIAIVFQKLTGENEEETAHYIADTFLFGIAVRSDA